MQRQDHFRKKDKIAPAIKGASALNVVEFHNYDTTVLRDDVGKCSHKVALSGQEHLISPKGDEDVWVEKILVSVKNPEKKRIYFVSRKTGIRSREEPPTGAKVVLYMKPEYRERKLRENIDTEKLERHTMIHNSPRGVATRKHRNEKLFDGKAVITIKKKERDPKFEFAKDTEVKIHRNNKEMDTPKESLDCNHSIYHDSINTGLICLCPHDEHGRRGLERSVNCGKLEISDDDDDSSLISM